MSNAYIRTVTGDAVTLTPFHAVELERFGRCPGITVVDEMELDPLEFNKHVFPEIVQLCVELDGDLYIWREWKDLYS